jgi:hypothetical protein
MAKFASVLILLIVLILMNNLAANGTELKKDGAGVGFNSEKTPGWIIYCNELYKKCVLDSRLCS